MDYGIRIWDFRDWKVQRFTAINFSLESWALGNQLVFMAKRTKCRDCGNRLGPKDDYCGRCGAGVRQVPIGCAIAVVIGVVIIVFAALRFAMSQF
ncbi:MAG: hypothetical protein ACQKBV_10715 [Puniceicoccales bacterium]